MPPRKIVLLNKRNFLIQHLRGKLESGITHPNAFRATKVASELGHVHCLGSENPKITAKNVSSLLIDAEIDWRNAAPEDLVKLRVGGLRPGRNHENRAVRHYAGEYREASQKAAREWKRRGKQRRLYGLGVFKPRKIKPSAFLVCRRSLGSRDISSVDKKRAVRILEILNETESKAMKLSELREIVKREAIFPRSGKIKRAILHLRLSGMIDSSIKGWAIVSEKFAVVNKDLLKTKIELVTALRKFNYMGGIIGREYGGLAPPMKNPDGLQLRNLEKEVMRLKMELGRTKLGRIVVDDLHKFPQHLVEPYRPRESEPSKQKRKVG